MRFQAYLICCAACISLLLRLAKHSSSSCRFRSVVIFKPAAGVCYREVTLKTGLAEFANTGLIAMCYQQLDKLEEEKKKLIKLKYTLEQQYRREKDKKANKRREESRIRKEILQCADVICTTLSGAGSSSLKQDLAGR